MIFNDISSGIKHIEDLDTPEFLSFLKNLGKYEITEKVDGAQILFGIDENGFYTSRESKGGTRIYAVEDYPITFSTTYKRSAHILLESVLPLLKEAGLKPGDQVEAEVLYGSLPNVVPYSADTNYLIFLRTTSGDVNIDNLKAKLDNQSLSLSLVSPYTVDGRSIQLQEENHSWKISRSPVISVNYKKINRLIEKDQVELLSYLKSPSGIFHLNNLEVSVTPLNKRLELCDPKDWKYLKEDIRKKKEEINEFTSFKKLKIKNILLDNIVKNRGSHFGPLVEDGGWIEGVVFKDTKTGKTVKLVDKKLFGAIREFAWEVRNKLTERAKSTEGNLSFMGSLYVDMAAAIGHPELGTIRSKSYYQKLNLTESFADLNLDSIKEYWINLLENRSDKLLLELNKYEKEKSSKVVRIFKDEKICEENYLNYGQGYIDRRTKEVFASLFEQIETHKKMVNTLTSFENLIEILL